VVLKTVSLTEDGSHPISDSQAHLVRLVISPERHRCLSAHGEKHKPFVHSQVKKHSSICGLHVGHWPAASKQAETSSSWLALQVDWNCLLIHALVLEFAALLGSFDCLQDMSARVH
jgi:hypothetical protein